MPIALTSTDGRSWTEHSSQHGYGPMIYAQNTFVMVAGPQNGDGPRNNFAWIITTPDGINWTSRVATTVNSIVGAAGARGLVAIGISRIFDIGNTGVFLASTNGTEWRETQRLVGEHLGSIAYGSGLFVAAGGTGIFSSPDGATWTRQTNAGAGWSRLRYGINKFLVL